MRAVLLASATATTNGGRLCRSRIIPVGSLCPLHQSMPLPQGKLCRIDHPGSLLDVRLIVQTAFSKPVVS